MTPPASLPMTAEAVRTRAALTREFLDRNMAPADVETLRMALNKYVSEKDTGLKARQMVEELFKILPDAFPPAVLDGGLDDVIYSRTMVLLHHAIEKKNQFDWDWGTLYNGEFFWHEWVREVKNYLDVEQRTAQRTAGAQSPGAGGGQGSGSGMAPGAGTGGARGGPAPGGGQAAPGTPPGRQGGTMPTGASPSTPGSQSPGKRVRFDDNVASIPRSTAASRKYVYEDGTDVPQFLIRKMIKDNTDGHVHVNGSYWRIKEKDADPSSSDPTADEVDPALTLDAMPTAERAASMLGYRTGGVYSSDYDRMGGTILRNIMAAGCSGVEAYVRTHHADLAKERRAMYEELLSSARTVDLKLLEYRNRTRDELENDDIFEMHISKIGMTAYQLTTGNVAGAKQMMGFNNHLIPQKVADAAAMHANAQAKLANNLRSQPGLRTNGSQANQAPGGGGKGGGKGYVPPEERRCYECNARGHEAKDCPVRKARLAKEEAEKSTAAKKENTKP